MLNINQQNFEHEALEADIERLSREIAEKKKLIEYKELPERELVKKSLEPMIKPVPVGGEPIVKGQESTVNGQILPDYLKDSPPEIKLQVEKLIDSVFHQGIEKTVKEANQAGPFILDAFHDALTDKLYDELKKRNLI